MPERVLVAVATYRRPRELTRLLDALGGAAAGAEVLVVDNDPSGSARDVVAAHLPDARYAHEPRPGIVAARNLALEQFTDEFDALIFLDDDEWVDAAWFDALTAFAQAHPGDVIRGPVETHLPADAPRWASTGTLFQRRPRPSGTQARDAATHNVLVPREAWVRAGAPRFDPAFTTTGGEDTDFFTTLRLAGVRIVWCAEAVAHEDVPRERLRFGWVVRRAVREGIVDTIVRRKHGLPVLRGVVRGLPKSLVLAVTALVRAVTGKGPDGPAIRGILFEIGRVLGLLGVRIRAYRG